MPSIEQAVTEKLKALNDYQQLQKDMRFKEQEYIKKIAIQEQKIEILELKLKDADERDANQRKLYERMFQALESSPLKPHHGSSPLKLKSGDPNQSLGSKEFELLNKQLMEQMETKVKDIELQLMTKDQEIAQFRINEIQLQQRHQQSLEELNQAKKDKETQLASLKKFINEKDYELERLISANKRLEDDLKHMTDR